MAQLHFWIVQFGLSNFLSCLTHSVSSIQDALKKDITAETNIVYLSLKEAFQRVGVGRGEGSIE